MLSGNMVTMAPHGNQSIGGLINVLASRIVPCAGFGHELISSVRGIALGKHLAVDNVRIGF